MGHVIVHTKLGNREQVIHIFDGYGRCLPIDRTSNINGQWKTPLWTEMDLGQVNEACSLFKTDGKQDWDTCDSQSAPDWGRQCQHQPPPHPRQVTDSERPPSPDRREPAGPKTLPPVRTDDRWPVSGERDHGMAVTRLSHQVAELSPQKLSPAAAEKWFGRYLDGGWWNPDKRPQTQLWDGPGEEHLYGLFCDDLTKSVALVLCWIPFYDGRDRANILM